MLNVLYSEILKFKRCKATWLLPMGGIIPVLLNFVMTMNMKAKGFPVEWEKYFASNLILMSLVMAPVLFYLLSGYIFSREYTENTVNTLFTYPINKSKFIFAKLTVIFIMIMITFLFNFTSLLLSGYLVIHKALTFQLLMKEMKHQWIMGISFFTLAPLGGILGSISKNVISPIALGICAVLGNIVISSSEYMDVYPWTIPFALIYKEEGHVPLYLKGSLILAIILIFSVSTLIFYLKKTDVQAGS